MHVPSWLMARLPCWLGIRQAGYPRNQAFSLRRGSLVPGRKLAKRVRLLLRLYPAHIDSLLDIGCAQGFFVFDAASRYPDARVVGIEASDSYQDLWREVSGCLNLSNVQFYQGLLHEFVQRPEDLGGPFQTVLLVNTYHYLYFGSGLQPFGYRDHGRIFQMLSRLCSERLIWSSPLENRDCPGYSQRGDSGADYTRDRILGAARKYFTVEAAGSLGRRPVHIMYVRPEVGQQQEG
jgi:SAM-dependent methyltransferase